jgi:hypothetical protein
VRKIRLAETLEYFRVGQVGLSHELGRRRDVLLFRPMYCDLSFGNIRVPAFGLAPSDLARISTRICFQRKNSIMLERR